MQYTIGEETKIEYDVVCGQKVTADTEVAVPIVSVAKPEPLIPERYAQVDYITLKNVTQSRGSYINLNSVSNYDIWGYSVSFVVDPSLWDPNNGNWCNIIGFGWGTSYYERLAIGRRDGYSTQMIVRAVQGTNETAAPGGVIYKSSMAQAFNTGECFTITRAFQHINSNHGNPYATFAYSSLGKPFRWNIYTALTNNTGSASMIPLTNSVRSSYGRDESFYLFSYGVNGKPKQYSYYPVRIFEVRFYRNVGKEYEYNIPQYTKEDVIAWWYPVYDKTAGVYGMYDVVNRCFRSAGPCSYYGEDNITGPEIINS